MLDRAGFRALYPEFAGVVDSMIDAALTDASTRVSLAVFGVQINRAHGLQAAHILVSSAWGGAARLDAKGKSTDGATTYSALLKQMTIEKAALRGMT